MTAAGAAARWAKPGARERAASRMKHHWEDPEARARQSARIKQSLRYKPERTMSDERDFFEQAGASTLAQQAMALAYRRGLMKAIEDAPHRYGWAQVPEERGEAVRTMAIKMMRALAHGEAGWNSQGWKNACKELGIRHQLQSILAYWRG